MSITEAEVILAQKAWAILLWQYAKHTQKVKDYKIVAKKRCRHKMYAYDEGKVLFKPTKAAHK